MRNGPPSLTEREKETLRLLVAGHDAKSIARLLGLSVHTINERLRDARRKLDVSSSREAARLLIQAERADPYFLADKPFGVPVEAGDAHPIEQADRRSNAGHRLAWFGGGMLIMSLVVAAVALSSAFHGRDAQGAPVAAPAATITRAAASASLRSAREWLALVDRQQWEESWRTAATLFNSQITAPQLASAIQGVRQPLGSVSSRTFQNVTKATSLPGAPPGDYEVIQFRTDFARKAGAVETVALVREQAGWRVAGYFIR